MQMAAQNIATVIVLLTAHGIALHVYITIPEHFKQSLALKGLFTIFFLLFKSHILDSNGVWYS